MEASKATSKTLELNCYKFTQKQERDRWLKVWFVFHLLEKIHKKFKKKNLHILNQSKNFVLLLIFF